MADKAFELIKTELDGAGLTILDLDVHVGEARVEPSTDGKIHVSVKVSQRNDWFKWHKSAPENAKLEVEHDNERLSLTLKSR